MTLGVAIGWLASRSAITVASVACISLVGLACVSIWPSLVLVGSLTAGLFKATPELQAFLSIDLTLVFALLVFLSGFARLVRSRSSAARLLANRWFLGLFLAFCLILIAGLTITPSPNYGLDKTLKFIGVAGPAVLLVLLWERRHLGQFLKVLFLFSCVMAFHAIVRPRNASGFLTAFSSNYLGLARQVGYGALIGFVHLLAEQKNVLGKFLVFSVSMTLTVVVLMSGGRGPVVAFILSMTALSLYECVFSSGPILGILKRTVPAIGLGFLVLVLTSVSPFGLFDTAKARFTLLVRETGPSALTRISLAKTALSTFSANWLLGTGVGGFSKQSTGFDCREYPHNLLLEVASEMGIVGLVLLSALIVVSLRRFHRAWRSTGITDRSILRTALALFAFAFFNACVSGDLVDNRMVFVTLALLSSVPNVTGAADVLEGGVL